MHLCLALEPFGLSEFRALCLDGVHLLLFITDLVANGARTDCLLYTLLSAIDGAAVVAMVMTACTRRCVACARNGVLERMN